MTKLRGNLSVIYDSHQALIWQ